MYQRRSTEDFNESVRKHNIKIFINSKTIICTY